MTFYLRQFLSAAIIFCAVSAVATASAKKPRTEEEAKQADNENDALKTWNSVHRFYKQFSQCDDGGVAEGVSEAVAKLLANQWDSVGELVKLGSKDKGFEDFVVRHVDETIDWDRDAPKIHENARLHCPANSRRLCKALVGRTTFQKK